MRNRWKNGVAISLIPQIILVRILALFPQWVEAYYSQGIYPQISRFFRTLFGWIPFSAGDLLYAALIILAVSYLYREWNMLRRKPLVLLRDLLMVLAVAHLTFYLSWGMNYYREPLHKSLGLSDKYSQEALESVTEQLMATTNALQLRITGQDSLSVTYPMTKAEIFQKTLRGYELLQGDYPSLKYSQPSLKKSLFSTGLSYMGYGGYLNPFTHEAQVNGKIPKFRYPVVSGHEIGHQLGYSAENEVNFIGYLATLYNEDIYFRYSASAYALGYCLRELRLKDQVAYKRIYAQLHPGVKQNYEEVNAFWKKYENPMEPVFKSIFNTFLKANRQKQGIRSYGLVVSLLVNYHEKNPLVPSLR
ncbi:MAG: DUF3810 domain-containing protein [Eudoraea sp.]|nr:DUF3810 domain-containing protein [Eudoraea sp.]